MLIEDCKEWIKNDKFFRIHSLTIISKSKKIVDPSHWKRTGFVNKSIADMCKTQEICKKAVEAKVWTLRYLPNQHRTQEMCNKATELDPWSLFYVPSHRKAQGMC